MTDGNVMLLDVNEGDNSSNIRVKLETQFKECGGVWSISSVNNDKELALGCLNGVFIAKIEAKELVRTSEQYL